MRKSVKVVLAAVAVGGAAGAVWDGAGAYGTYRDGLHEYMAVRLGDGMPEVRYARGNPQFVLGNPPPGDPAFSELPQGALWVMSTDPESADVKNRMPRGADIDDYLYWEYGSAERYVRAKFDPVAKLVTEITCHTPPGEGEFVRECGPVFGFYGQNEEQFVEAFGDPTSSLIDATSGTKDMIWDGLGLRFTLIQRKAYSARKFAPRGAGFMGFLRARYL